MHKIGRKLWNERVWQLAPGCCGNVAVLPNPNRISSFWAIFKILDQKIPHAFLDFSALIIISSLPSTQKLRFLTGPSMS